MTTPYNPCKVLLIFVSDQATTRSLSNPQENHNKQKWWRRNITRFSKKRYNFTNFLAFCQELFSKIDLEDDGIVYLKEIVIYLRAMNEDIDTNLEVIWHHSFCRRILCYNIANFRLKFFLINMRQMEKKSSNSSTFV